MPITKVLARDATFEINDGTEAVPDWLEIKGVTSLTFNPTKNDADTTDFDSEGVLEHLPASRGLAFTMGGFRLEDRDTGDRDPGQAAVEAYDALVGPDGLASFRITTPAGDVYAFSASVSVTPHGGGNDDPASWSVTITRSGPTTYTPAGT